MLSNDKIKKSSVVKLSAQSGHTFVAFLIAALLLTSGALNGCSAAEQAGSSVGESTESATAKPARPPVATPDMSDREAKTASFNPPTVAPQARAVVRNGSLSIRVPDVEKAEKEVTRFVSTNGGFVSNSESSNLSETSPTVTMTVRVPVRLFDASFDAFERMGTRLAKKVSGEDVTTKIVDFDARLKTMDAQEESFRNLLRTSGRSSEAFDLQTRLMNLREEIESIRAQRKALSDMAQLSTVELTLVGAARGAAKTEDKNWALESWNSATSSFSWFAQGIGSLAIFMAVFSPIWIPCAAFFWWLVKRNPSKPKPGQA